MDITLDGITYHLKLYAQPDGESSLPYRLRRLMAQELEAAEHRSTSHSLISRMDKE